MRKLAPPLFNDLSFRYGRPEDFAGMYASCFADAPQDKTHPTYRQIKHEWDVFTSWPTTVTFVVEHHAQGRKLIRGCGQMVFVSDDYVRWAHQTPDPGLNGEAASPDKPYLLTTSEMRKVNGTRGVNGLLTRWHSGTQDAVTEEFRSQVRAVLYRAMMTCFLGYQYREIIGETYGAKALEYACDSGFSVLSTFPKHYEGAPPDAPRFGAVYVTRDLAFKRDSSRVSQLFTDYRKPRLNLNDASQQLLRLAALGYSDKEIAEASGLTLRAIQQRWYTLATLERDHASVRQLINGSPYGSGKMPEGENAVNRHLWVQFVKKYPEELRPHDGKFFKTHIKAERTRVHA